VLILFFELNTPANVSLIKIVKLVVIGGAISLPLSLFLFEATPFLGVFGASAAGVVEEVGKLGALLLALSVAERAKYKYRLNGLLLGSAIGTGFAAFESAGYALRYGISGAADMADIINLRGALSPFGHIAWTAIAASAFWIARPFHSDIFSTIRSAQFLRVFLIPVTLHFIWNLPFQGPFMIKYVVLGFAAWVVVISLVQSGLKEMANCCPD
jgi:RsiW-degrading membrane proteinase PrsW (M82 family)